MCLPRVLCNYPCPVNLWKSRITEEFLDLGECEYRMVCVAHQNIQYRGDNTQEKKKERKKHILNTACFPPCLPPSLHSIYLFI